MATIPDVCDLSLEEKVGQVLCYGWQGASPEESSTVNAHAREVIRDMGAGSLVLLGRNVSSPEQTRAMIGELQSLSRIPLFIAVDQEGGTVNRFRAPFHEFPGNMALGAIPEGVELAERQATAVARELPAVGVNWNFAPCVDVNNNPDNPIIGVRSFGEDPFRVAELSAAAVRGYQSQGVVACAKHFPGHGDTSADSHLALPTVTGDRRRIDAVELLPFRRAIQEGVGAIMTTHILFPALDPDRPATLSPAVLTGLLRSELGYDGLVITDCLEMNAIADTFGTPRGAVEALKAGADIALVCHTLETQRATRQAILDAVARAELPESRLHDAAARVLASKRRFLANVTPDLGRAWEDPAIDALEAEIAHRSITVVRDMGGIPLRCEGSLLLVTAHHSGERLLQELRRYNSKADLMAIAPGIPQSQVSEAVERARAAKSVLVATAPPEPWSNTPIDQERQAALVSALQKAAPNLLGVALREPYDIRRFTSIPNYVCTYGYRPCSLRALADVLFGAAPAVGCLPVTIPGISV